MADTPTPNPSNPRFDNMRAAIEDESISDLEKREDSISNAARRDAADIGETLNDKMDILDRLGNLSVEVSIDSLNSIALQILRDLEQKYAEKINSIIDYEGLSIPKIVIHNEEEEEEEEEKRRGGGGGRRS
jgi:hypothetical protein